MALVEILQIIISGIFGAIFGSYATLFSYRLPLNESCFGRYFGPKSRCPNCQKILKTRELIPIINWLITLGKCSKCGFKIPRSHLFLEFSCAILFMVNYHLFGFSDNFILFNLIIVSCLIAIVIDFKYRFIPQEIIYVLLLISLCYKTLSGTELIDIIMSATIGIIISCLFYKLLYGEEKKGFISNHKQAFSYALLIIITAIPLNLIEFFLYIACICLIISLFMIFGNFSSKSSPRLASSLIVPFIWLLIYSPINF